MKKIMLWIVMMLGLVWFSQAALLDEAVSWMNENDLTIFKTVIEYKPNNYIRRDEAAKLFVKFAKLQNKITYIKTAEECKFSDLNDAHADLKDIVVESCRLGIFQWANGKFMPRWSLTNEQAVVVLVRILVWNQSEKNINSWSDNYYNKAYGLLILWQVSMWDKKISATRGNVGIVLANASDNMLNSILNISRYQYLDEIIQKITQKEALEIYEYSTYTERYNLTTTQWNLIKDEYLARYKELWEKYNLSDVDIQHLRNIILIDFYYTMIKEKQYDIAVSLTESWSSTSKQLADIYKNSWNIYINWLIKKIKNNIYQFMVNIEDTVTPSFEKFNVQKEISSNNKIKSISSKRIDKYLCIDMGCGDSLIPYDKWLTLKNIWKELDKAITLDSAKGRIESIKEYKRLSETKLYQKERLDVFIKKSNISIERAWLPEYYLDENLVYSIDVVKDTNGNRKYQFILYNNTKNETKIDGHLTLWVKMEDAPLLISPYSWTIKASLQPNQYQTFLFDENSPLIMTQFLHGNTKPIWLYWTLYQYWMANNTKVLNYSTWILFN